MSKLIDKIDEAITHIADTHEDFTAMMMLEKAKDYAREAEKEKVELEEKVYSSLVHIHTIWAHSRDGYKELAKEKYDYVMDLLINAIPFDEIEERVCRSEDDE